MGSSHCLHQQRKDSEGTKHQDQWGYVFSEPPPPLWHGGIFLEVLKALWEKNFWDYSHSCILLWSEVFKETMMALLRDADAWPTLPALLCFHLSLHPRLGHAGHLAEGLSCKLNHSHGPGENTLPRKGEEVIFNSELWLEQTLPQGQQLEVGVVGHAAGRGEDGRASMGKASAGLVSGTLILWNVSERNCKQEVISALILKCLFLTIVINYLRSETSNLNPLCDAILLRIREELQVGEFSATIPRVSPIAAGTLTQ